MSVIMTLRVKGDASKLEQIADPATMASIRDHAVEHGLIAHRFYGSADEIMVVDEWPDEQSFHSFFEHAAEHIKPMMDEVAQSEPVITFWRKLETHDEYGWGA